MNARPLPARQTTPASALDRATRRLEAELKRVRDLHTDSWAWARELLPDTPNTATGEVPRGTER